MASSYSSDLKLELMVTGEKSGLWGDITNTNLTILQQAIAGYEEVSIAGGVQTTPLVFSNGLVSDGKNAVIKLTGTITGNQTVTIPDSIEKTYIIENGTTGAFTVQFKTVSGTGPTWSTTDKGIKILFSDGTNVVDVNADLSASTFASISSGAISSGQIDILAQAELRLQDTTGGQYVGFKAPGTVSSSYTLTLPTATGAAGQTLVTNGSGVLSFASAGLSWQSVQTTGFTAVKGNAYPCDTTSAAFTVTLPATPSAGDQVQLVDYAGTFDTNALTIDPNGEDIEGGTDNLQLTGEREGVILTYIDSTQGWIATSGINEGTDALEPLSYSIDFLVVAGGGSGGESTQASEPVAGGGGGGGAGGFRTSTQSVAVGTVITVTVGDGGAGGGNNSGSNSSISGSGLTTITSAGGGSGGGASSALTGGSGGGGSSQSTTGASGNTPSTSPSQGSAGGNGLVSSPTMVGGGGGGAGAVGGNGSTPFTGGNGGNGSASSITGSSVTYAGGGGGGARNSTGSASTAGTGGTGGGGRGAQELAPQAPVAGTANTGGGGGGNHAYASTASAAGGKGVVILSVPTANYSSTTTGSPTVTTDGTDTIMQFNGSGSYTA
jgi:hypothetical protein